MIERIIHQIWHPFSSAEMPRDWQRFARSWRRFHPDHEHVLWGPEESRAFVAAHYPGFLKTYDEYPQPIQRVDSLRVLLLHHFGGVYVDLDVECLRNVEALLEGQRVVFPAEPTIHWENWRHKGYRRILATAFMASEARHPFWQTVIDEMQRSAHLPDVMDSTGPFVLTRCYELDPDRHALTVAPPETIYPIHALECQDGGAYDLEYWMRTTAGAYGIHHWASTWNRPGESFRPASRPYPFGIPTKIKHPAMERGRVAQPLAQGPLVSCLMVSRGWVEPARWAVECFRNQTYANRELVVVTANESGDLQAWLEGLRDPRIRFVGPLPSGTPLGALRNRAVDAARGELVCTWDDDDLFGADRLAAGVTALVTSGAAASFLERICIWWPARQQLVVSGRHWWENTMIARRSALPRYEELERAEDSRAVAQLVRKHPVALVDDPNLFFYVVSGANTWGPDHFQRFVGRATFRAERADYDRALTVANKHVPILDYLEWLQRRDPKTFDPPVDSPARLDASVAPAGADAPAARASARRRRPTVVSPQGAPGPLRFVFAWELGGGLGHTVPLSQLARPLLEAGHDVHLVLRDLSTSRAALGRLAEHPRLRLWQAPHWSAPLQGFSDAASYPELLFRAGYLDPQRLNGLFDGWDALFRQLEPDLLVADHAPTALLAARGHRFPRASFGTGFFDPPPGSPMPAFRTWEPIPRARLEQADRLVLRTCNDLLAARSLSPLEQVADLLRTDERFLLTVPELDHYERGEGDAPTYWGAFPPATQGRPAQWPHGSEPAVFAYLKAQGAPIRDILKTLRDSPWRVLAYVPDLVPQVVSELSSRRMLLVTDPVDMVEVSRTADVVLCHAGFGTVGTALHAGKPLMMLPSYAEQFLVARRVQQMGAGLLLLESQVERLRAPLDRVVTQPSFREAAEAFARRHADAAGAAVVEAVAARCVELAEAGRASARSVPSAAA